MTYLNQFCGSSQAFRLYMYMWPSWIEIKYNSIVYSSLAFKMIASVLRAGFVFVWEGRGSYNFCGKGGACTTSVGRAGLIQLCGNGRACTTSVGRAGLIQLLWEGRDLYNFCGKGGAHTTLWKWPGLYNFCGKGGARAHFNDTSDFWNGFEPCHCDSLSSQRTKPREGKLRLGTYRLTVKEKNDIPLPAERLAHKNLLTSASNFSTRVYTVHSGTSTPPDVLEMMSSIYMYTTLWHHASNFTQDLTVWVVIHYQEYITELLWGTPHVVSTHSYFHVSHARVITICSILKRHPHPTTPACLHSTHATLLV